MFCFSLLFSVLMTINPVGSPCCLTESHSRSDHTECGLTAPTSTGVVVMSAISNQWQNRGLPRRIETFRVRPPAPLGSYRFPPLSAASEWEGMRKKKNDDSEGRGGLLPTWEGVYSKERPQQSLTHMRLGWQVVALGRIDRKENGSFWRADLYFAECRCVEFGGMTNADGAEAKNKIIEPRGRLLSFVTSHSYSRNQQGQKGRESCCDHCAANNLDHNDPCASLPAPRAHQRRAANALRNT